MTGLVSISPSYPTVPPVFCLSLKNGDNTHTQETSEVIRDLEREINVEVGDTSRPGLLSIMIHKLLLLTDIVLEVETSLGRTCITYYVLSMFEKQNVLFKKFHLKRITPSPRIS